MNDNPWINFISCRGIDHMFVIKKNGSKIFNFFFISIKIIFEIHCFYFSFSIQAPIISCIFRSPMLNFRLMNVLFIFNLTLL